VRLPLDVFYLPTASTIDHCAHKPRTLKRSSRVIPGFRGTPAGMTTTLAPVKASPRPWLDLGGHDPGDGSDPVTLATVGICRRIEGSRDEAGELPERKQNKGVECHQKMKATCVRRCTVALHVRG
jgi:hypothetical protein